MFKLLWNFRPKFFNFLTFICILMLDSLPPMTPSDILRNKNCSHKEYAWILLRVIISSTYCFWGVDRVRQHSKTRKSEYHQFKKTIVCTSFRTTKEENTRRAQRKSRRRIKSRSSWEIRQIRGKLGQEGGVSQLAVPQAKFLRKVVLQEF